MKYPTTAAMSAAISVLVGFSLSVPATAFVIREDVKHQKPVPCYPAKVVA